MTKSVLTYRGIKGLVIRVLKVPPEPDPPTGSSDSQVLFRAAPSYYTYRFVAWIIRQVVLGFTLLFVAGVGAAFVTKALETSAPIAIALTLIPAGLLWLATLMFSYATLRLDYEMRWYMVSDRSLRIREGVVHVREMTMTFANIQNISISQGPLQRIFGIADLKVETAGGGGGQHQQGAGVLNQLHTGFFRGVDNAESIRDLMLQRLKRLRDSGLGDEAESETDETKPPGLTPASILALRALRDEAVAFRRAAELG